MNNKKSKVVNDILIEKETKQKKVLINLIDVNNPFFEHDTFIRNSKGKLESLKNILDRESINYISFKYFIERIDIKKNGVFNSIFAKLKIKKKEEIIHIHDNDMIITTSNYYKLITIRTDKKKIFDEINEIDHVNNNTFKIFISDSFLEKKYCISIKTESLLDLDW